MFNMGYAVPSQRGIIAVPQADGTTINVQIVGDEHFHYYLSEDNYLLEEADGIFYFAVPDENGLPAE